MRPNAKRISKADESQTDWAAIDELTDDYIDASDIPPLDEGSFAQAEMKVLRSFDDPGVRVDREVLDWFRNQEEDCQSLINSVLRKYMETHSRQISTQGIGRIHP